MKLYVPYSSAFGQSGEVVPHPKVGFRLLLSDFNFGRNRGKTKLFVKFADLRYGSIRVDFALLKLLLENPLQQKSIQP